MKVHALPMEMNEKKREKRTTDLLPADWATKTVSGAQRMEKKDSESRGIPSSGKTRSRRSLEDILEVT